MTLKRHLSGMPMPSCLIRMHSRNRLGIKIPASKTGNTPAHFNETLAYTIK
jgi:hypothetical protein